MCGQCRLMPETHAQDVTSREDGHLIGRAFVSAPTLLTLQGSISATLISPQLEMVRTRLLAPPGITPSQLVAAALPSAPAVCTALPCSVMCAAGPAPHKSSTS